MVDSELTTIAETTHQHRARSIVFVVVCVGVSMVVLDTTIVTVALPTMLNDLHINPAKMSWTMNAYLLAFGGLLLLSGRLGDMYGTRCLYAAGIAIFTIASLACGLAHGPEMLFVARAVQGAGSAIVTAVSLSLILTLFPEIPQRSSALAIYSLICAAGGGVGEIVGGLLTQRLNWRWIFLVNVPIGVVVYVCSITLLPRTDEHSNWQGRLDVRGALTVTLAITLLIYGLIGGGAVSECSRCRVGLLVAGLFFAVLFVRFESNASSPLISLTLFSSTNFGVANVVGAFWSTTMYSWFVLGALYLQNAVGYTPFEVGLAYLPGEVATAIMAVGFSGRILKRFGTRFTLCSGLWLSSAGLALLSRAPAQGLYWTDVLPSMTVLGIGAGIASPALLLSAANGLPDKEAGVASGIINTSIMLGGALGLALLVGISEHCTRDLRHSGVGLRAAVGMGYQVALLSGATGSAISAVLAAIWMQRVLAPESVPHKSGVTPAR